MLFTQLLMYFLTTCIFIRVFSFRGCSSPDLPSGDSTTDIIYKHLSYSTDYHFKPVVSPQHSLKAAKARQATTQRDVIYFYLFKN